MSGKNYKDLSGQKFGRLLVIERVANHPYKNGRVRVKFKCLCDCGNISEVMSISLVSGMTKSCGCLKKELTSKRTWKGYEEIGGSLLGSIKSGAKRRDIEYSLTDKYIWELFLKQDRKCALTGVEIGFARDNRNRINIQTASLDRIDSTKGYIENNVWWIHKDINQLKWNFTLDKLYKLCKDVVSYQDVINKES